MAAERKTKTRRKLDEMEEKPTKEEYAVAKYLRFNAPVRAGKLVGMDVQCFFSNKAIDTLMESKWSAAKCKKDPLFNNRGSCVMYCHRLLQKGLFHRAEKVQRSKDRDKTKKKKKLKDGEKDEESVEETVRERKKRDRKSRKGDSEKSAEEEQKDDGGKKDEKSDKNEEKKEEKKDEEKKKKEKKLKLQMHDDQRFVDGEEVYVWIYDPVPVKTFLIGLLMVFGAIGLCLFPLWPEEVRVGVYYLSLAAAGFVGFILSLVVVRFILFCLVWIATLGKHHFWFLPNLTEDVGFFDSFKPLYKHEYFGKDGDKSKDKKGKDSKKKDKGKDEDKGSEGDTKTETVEKDENSGSDKSENGEFELVDKEDVAEEETEEDMEGENENGENDDNEDENDLDEDESEEESNEKKKER